MDKPAAANAPSPLFRVALDYGPLAVFFLLNLFGPGPALARIIAATIGFMIAMVVAVALSWVKTRHVSPMLWITAVLVIVFGGLTVWFHDDRFIKMKPTFVYGVFAALLFFGLVTGRPLLQSLLGTAYPGLDAVGWRKLTRNWAVFFLVMAVLNEAVWRYTAATMSADAASRVWTLFKFPGCVIITFLFAIANVPMLLRHGLMLEKDEAVAGELPPE